MFRYTPSCKTSVTAPGFARLRRDTRYCRPHGIFAVLFYCAAGAVWARPPVYTLEDCLDIGLRRAGAVRNALRDEHIAEAAIGATRAQILPQIKTTATYTRRDTPDTVEFGDQHMEIGSADNYAAGATLQQLLYSGGSVRAGLRAARDYRVLTGLQTARTRAGLTREIRAAFTDLLLLEAAVGVHEQALAQLGELAERAEARFRREQAAEFEVLNARVQLANARPELLRAVNNLEVARTAFADLIRLDDPDFGISGELLYEPFERDAGSLMERALRRRPEMAVMEQHLILQAADLRIERGAYLPVIHATAGYSGQAPSGPLSTESDWDWRWTAGLQAQWQWTDGGLRRWRIRQKMLERDKLKEDREILRRRIVLEARQGLLRVGHAAAAVEAARESVALALKALEIARSRYETGLTTRLEYTEVSLALRRARLEWLRALRDHFHAVNDLDYATGEYN